MVLQLGSQEEPLLVTESRLHEQAGWAKIISPWGLYISDASFLQVGAPVYEAIHFFLTTSIFFFHTSSYPLLPLFLSGDLGHYQPQPHYFIFILNFTSLSTGGDLTSLL